MSDAPANESLGRDLLLVTALALIARVGAALVVSWPPYTDPAYYSLVAQQLATGHGFNVPVLWSFLEVGSRIPATAGLPVPSNGHWMPLTSIVAGGAMVLFGPTWHSGQIPMVVLSTLLVPLTYLIGWELWRSRTVALVGALLAIVPGPLLIMYPTIDNFAVFGTCGALALYSAVHAVYSPRPGWWIVLSGALAGLATLARIDGVLLVLAPATAWALTAEEGAFWAPRRLAWGAASAVAFVAVMTPWLLRDLSVFGSILPSTGGHTLWISSYNEQFSIGHAVNAGTYLASGLGNIAGSKAFAALELVARLAVLMGGIFIVFFVAGSWTGWRRPELRPFLVYFWVMFAVMALVFTFHAPKGAFYHSSTAWLPFALPMSVAAIPAFGRWAGRWWRILARPATHRFLAAAGLAGAVVLSGVGSAALYRGWDEARVQDVAAASFFEETGHTHDVVMSSEPASLYYFSGNPGVAASFDPYPVIEQIIRAYDVRWIYVQLPSGATRDPLGFWNGAAAVDADGNHATFLPATPAFEAPGRPHLPGGAARRLLIAREGGVVLPAPEVLLTGRTLRAEDGGRPGYQSRTSTPPQ